jgi:hypothetical protein
VLERALLPAYKQAREFLVGLFCTQWLESYGYRMVRSAGDDPLVT